MPSKNKTELLKLNQWQENEYPKMDDFNDDNKKIDDAYKGIVNKLNYKADKSYVDDKINDIDFTTLENKIDKKANEIHTHSANDITETTSKKFVTSSQLSNIDTITDKANKIHNHSATDITETYSKKFVTTSEKLKIKDIDGKADQEHTHSARDISETTSRNFVSDTQLSNINKITEKADKSYVDNQIITSTSDTGTKSVNNSNALLASTDARAQGGNAGVYSSRAAETNSITSAVIGSWKSQIKDTDPKYLRNTVMLASNEFEFDPSSANDNKVVGGYKGDLSWMLDSRNGEIYARDEIKIGSMKVKDTIENKSRTSTIVIANHDSHESSKKGADILINKGENASKKINDAIQSLKGTGGEVKLMEGTYNIKSTINMEENTILSGLGNVTILHITNNINGIETNNVNSWCSIRCLKIKGTEAAQTSYRAVTLRKNSTLEKCSVNSFQGFGVYLYDSSEIKESSFDDFKQNVVRTYGSENRICSCVFTNSRLTNTIYAYEGELTVKNSIFKNIRRVDSFEGEKILINNIISTSNGVALKYNDIMTNCLVDNYLDNVTVSLEGNFTGVATHNTIQGRLTDKGAGTVEYNTII